MFKETYHQMNNQIEPSDLLIENTINNTNGKRHSPRRMPMLAAAVLAACVILVTPVLAVSNPTIIYNIIYSISPSTAQFFKPVQVAYEDNGIRMEVAATYIHDNTAEIYVTMQDLTGDRIDETTDLFDSYSIHRPFDSAGTCSLRDYDPATKTATFLILISEYDNRNITGDKLTFSVKKFLSHKTEIEDAPIALDLSSAETGETKIPDYIRGYGSINGESHDDEACLLPGASLYPISDKFNVSAMGYVDEKLHIQLAMDNVLTTDSHGDFYLKDKTGNKIASEYSVSFVENQDTDQRADYSEFVFDVPQSKIADYSLYGCFYTSGLLTEGNWEVTFPLTNSN